MRRITRDRMEHDQLLVPLTQNGADGFAHLLHCAHAGREQDRFPASRHVAQEGKINGIVRSDFMRTDTTAVEKINITFVGRSGKPIQALGLDKGKDLPVQDLIHFIFLK